MLPQPTGPLLPTQNQHLTKNPMLPQLPNTGNMDSQYMAQEAQLRAQISKQYADILQQLGWIDDQGNFIPGTVPVAAARAQSDLLRQSGLAAEGTQNQATRTGTSNSGRLAVNTERAQQPYQRQIAQLGVDTPLQLGGLYEQASGLVDQYTLQNNIFLAEMAARQAAAITKNPAGAPADQNTGTTPTGGGTTQPPTVAPGGNQHAGNVQVPVTVGSNTSMEPKPGAGNIIPADDVLLGPEPVPVGQLPDGIVNPNPEAPGQVFTGVTVGSETSQEPKPNPGSYGQPDPVIVSPGDQMAPGSQLVGPDEMPKPNPGAYGQPIVDVPQLLDTINNALAATPAGDMAAGQAALNPTQPVPTKTKKPLL